MERVVERIHLECGFQTAREVHVPAWDCFHWKCTAELCARKGVAYAPLGSPCPFWGSARTTEREEAILDLEARSAELPRL